jgi:hypothetical protein
MELNGWSSPQMPGRYDASARGARACRNYDLIMNDLYGQRGYVPDGRGACRGQQPLSEGMQAAMDHDLIMWLTKDLAG